MSLLFLSMTYHQFHICITMPRLTKRTTHTALLLQLTTNITLLIPTRTAPCLSTKTQLHKPKPIPLFMVKPTTLVLLKTLIMAANPAVRISTGASTPPTMIPVSTAKKQRCTPADSPIASTTTTRVRRIIRGKKLKIL